MKYAIVLLLGITSAVRLHDCDGDADDHSCEVFSPQQDGMLDKGYERAVTPRFDADTDDIFMRSMIKTYALEKKNYDGSPSGVFIMNEAGARAAAWRFLRHIRDSPVVPETNTWPPTSPRPGDTLTSTL